MVASFGLASCEMHPNLRSTQLTNDQPKQEKVKENHGRPKEQCFRQPLATHTSGLERCVVERQASDAGAGGSSSAIDGNNWDAANGGWLPMFFEDTQDGQC